MPLLFPRPSNVFDPPTTLDHFLSSPVKFLARNLHRIFVYLHAPPVLVPHNKPAIKVVCISDTHNDTQQVPPGDLLIHAGDLTNNGTVVELQAQIDWLKSLPHTHKVVICGNHDSFFDPASRLAEDEGKTLSWDGIRYLQNSSITLTFPSRGERRLVVHGAPQIPLCGGSNFAFQHQRDEDQWTGTTCRQALVANFSLKKCGGCGRRSMFLHVFGHVHSGHGKEVVFWDEEQQIYERLCSRKDRGVILDLLDVWGWLDVGRQVCHGVGAVLWTRVWGGDSTGSLMVNAALAYQSTRKLGNPVHVVEI